MADRFLTWSTLRFPEKGVMLPAHYLEADYEPTAVRIYADYAGKEEPVTFDIFDDGVSIFADKDADNNDGTTNYQIQHVPNTKVGLEPGENAELMAENFKSGLVIDADSWITCKMYSDAGARNITIILELEKVSESDEDES